MSDDGLATPYDPNSASMVQYLMSINPELAMQLAPMLSPLNQGMVAGLAPDAGKLGTTGATNYVQDALSLNFDDALAAYGGAGAYAEGAFNPVTSTNVVETPGRRRLLQAMQQGTSIDSIIARHLFEGGTASDAFADINRKIQDAVKAGENATEDQQILLAQLPPSSNPNAIPGEVSSYDLSGVMDLARDMEQLAMSDPPEGTFAPTYAPDGTMISPGGERRWITDEQGNEVLVETTSKPSEVAQQYIDQGLSLPTDQYTPEGLLGKEWQDAAGALAGSREVQDAASRAMRMYQQNPQLAARQSEINEIPYGEPTNNAMRAQAPAPVVDPNANPYTTGTQGAYSEPTTTISGSISGGPGTSVLTPESVMAGTYVPAANMTDQAANVSPYDSDLGRPLRELMATLATPDQQQLLQILGQSPAVQTAAQTGPPPQPPYNPLPGNPPMAPPVVDPNAPPDVYGSDLGRPLAELQAQLGGGPGRSRRIMPQGKMLGGTEPEPPAPGTVDWANSIPGAQYNQPGAMGPPTVPPPNTTAPGLVSNPPDFYAYQGGYSPEGPQPTPDQILSILGQQPAGALGSPAWQNLLTQSINSSGQNLLPPSENERNQILGQTPGQPQQPGVLGIGDYLTQYVMGGGTQPHAGPPPQPPYNPLPGNPPPAGPSPGITYTGPLQPNANLLQQILGQQPTPPPGAPPGDMNTPQDLAAFLASAPPMANDPNRRTNNNPTAYSTGSPVMDMGAPAVNRPGGRGNNTPTSRVSGDPRGILDQLWRQPGAQRTSATPTSRTERPALTQQMLQTILGQTPTAPQGGGSGAPSSGALWQQMWQEAQQPTAPRYDPLSSANAGSQDRDRGTPGTGRNRTDDEGLREYNRGVGERAGRARRSAQRNLGFRQEDVDAWKAAVANNQRERSYYGAEYGRAAGLAYLMQRSGIRPLDRELAARGAVASGMGLRRS